jgi:O-antigen/teichoic acid export membrane protein
MSKYKELINKFSKPGVVKNTSILMLGTIVSQLIPIAISPVISRLFTPADFGVYSLYTAITGILWIFTSLKYNQAIVIAKNEEEASGLLIFSIYSTIGISILSGLIFYGFSNYIVMWIGEPALSAWIWIIPLTIFFNGLLITFVQWFNRKSKYKAMSVQKIVMSSTMAASNLLTGFYNLTSNGLILSNFLGFFSGTFFLLFKGHVISSIKQYYKIFTCRKWKTLLTKYKQFPLYSLPQALMFQLYLYLPVFFINSIFSSEILGAYTMTRRILVLPATVLIGSLGQVYYQKAAQMYASQRYKLYAFTRNTFILIFSTVAIGSLGVVYFLPNIFSFVLGADWVFSGVIGQYLLIYLVLYISISPFFQIYLVSKNNKFQFYWELFRLLTILVFFLIYKKTGNTDVNLFFLFFSILFLFQYVILATPVFYKKSFIWK